MTVVERAHVDWRHWLLALARVRGEDDARAALRRLDRRRATTPREPRVGFGQACKPCFARLLQRGFWSLAEEIWERCSACERVAGVGQWRGERCCDILEHCILEAMEQNHVRAVLWCVARGDSQVAKEALHYFAKLHDWDHASVARAHIVDQATLACHCAMLEEYAHQHGDTQLLRWLGVPDQPRGSGTRAELLALSAEERAEVWAKCVVGKDNLLRARLFMPVRGQSLLETSDLRLAARVGTARLLRLLRCHKLLDIDLIECLAAYRIIDKPDRRVLAQMTRAIRAVEHDGSLWLRVLFAAQCANLPELVAASLRRYSRYAARDVGALRDVLSRSLQRRADFSYDGTWEERIERELLCDAILCVAAHPMGFGDATEVFDARDPTALPPRVRCTPALGCAVVLRCLARNPRSS